MTNKYQVHSSHGIHDVTTDQHHDDHTDSSFKTHLGRILDGAVAGTVGGVVSSVIVHRFIFKGKA